MSSRNVHLSPDERAAATVLRRALVAARDAWTGGERSAEALRATMRAVLATEPLADVDYVSVADGAPSPSSRRRRAGARCRSPSASASTRLIDNETLDVTPREPSPADRCTEAERIQRRCEVTRCHADRTYPLSRLLLADLAAARRWPSARWPQGGRRGQTRHGRSRR